MESQFPEIAKDTWPSVKAENAILDGEVVALDENGSPSFQLLPKPCRVQGERLPFVARRRKRSSSTRSICST